MYEYRFQRTDQWMPVYSWLESLDTDELIKSKDVIDWLTANPDIRDHLYTRHSRHHLMHYIKKCHVKILKRKEKQMLKCGKRVDRKHVLVDWIQMQQPVYRNGLIVAKIPPSRNDSSVEVRAPGSPLFTGNNLSSMPKDSELYKAKHSEASRKYEMLVELEKQLIPLFGKRENS